MRNTVAFICAGSLLCCSSAFGQAASSDPAIEDYATSNGVSVDEAKGRFARLSEIADVEKKLMEKFPNQFGGLYVVHSPSFKIVVKMTGGGQGLLKQITNDPSYVVEKAVTPVNQLNQLKDRIGRKLVTDGNYAFSAEVNVWDGTVDIKSTDIAKTRAALTNDLAQNKNIRLVEVASVSENTATIYGGRAATGTINCTTGFNVTMDGGPGIVTAGHCANTLTIAGVTFNVVSEAYKDSTEWGFDIQTMRPSSAQTYPNQIYYTTGTLTTITKVQYASDIPLDWPVCVYGVVTNKMRCGKLKSKWLVLKDNNQKTNAVFKITPDDGKAMNIEGDSGGPVFGSATAYGIIKAKGGSSNPNDLYFVDIQSMQAIGGLNIIAEVKVAP